MGKTNKTLNEEISIFDGFTDSDNELDQNKILSDLMTAGDDDDHDMELKTEIKSPSAYAMLYVVETIYDQLKLRKSSKLLKQYRLSLIRSAVSWNREGRRECIKAIANINEVPKPTTLDKALGKA